MAVDDRAPLSSINDNQRCHSEIVVTVFITAPTMIVLKKKRIWRGKCDDSRIIDEGGGERLKMDYSRFRASERESRVMTKDLLNSE